MPGGCVVSLVGLGESAGRDGRGCWRLPSVRLLQLLQFLSHLVRVLSSPASRKPDDLLMQRLNPEQTISLKRERPRMPSQHAGLFRKEEKPRVSRWKGCGGVGLPSAVGT
jgi:hypothetical protein